MAEYTITDPKDIRIKSLLLSDIQGMHTLLKKEGCIDSENKFSDGQKAIALDADVLLCVTGNKYLLADAKFNSTSVSNNFGAYQGAKYFSYNGKVPDEIRKEKEQ
jgi:hypothetical protein